MAKNISVGIDIGSHNIKVVVGERSKDAGRPNILGVGFSESRGLRHGYVVGKEEVAKSIQRAVKEAEKVSRIRIKEAYIALGGISLDSVVSTGSTIISRGDNEITSLDVARALEASEEMIPKEDVVNQKIIHTIPLRYRIDGKDVLGHPEGMRGVKLEIDVLFIFSLEQHLSDLVQAVEDAGIEVEDVVAAPLAASIVTLTKAQRIAGVVLANIGAETVSLVVYDNNIPISLKVFPIGSTNITNDIALGLKIPLDEAEQIKLGGFTGASVSKKRLDEIIVNRLENIFELIDKHLKKIKKDGMLPAGIVLTGGGSGVTTIEDLARGILELPSKIADMYQPKNTKVEVQDAMWSVAYGLTLLGLTDSGESVGIKLVKTTGNSLKSWFRQFLP